MHHTSAGRGETCRWAPAHSPLAIRTMLQRDERTILGLTVRIDRRLCVGFGDCIEEAPEVFELDSEGVAIFRVEDGAVDRVRLLAACRACPVDARTVLDARGTQLAP
jgi:ferredoxin